MGFTHVVEQLSSSLFFSILTFDFDLIFWSILTFWVPDGLYWRLEMGSKTVLRYTHFVEQLSIPMFDSKTVLGSTHVVEQLSFSLCFFQF